MFSSFDSSTWYHSLTFACKPGSRTSAIWIDWIVATTLWRRSTMFHMYVCAFYIHNYRVWNPCMRACTPGEFWPGALAWHWLALKGKLQLEDWRNPHWCLSLSLCVPLLLYYLSLSLTLFVSLSLSLCFCLSFSLPPSISFSLILSLSLSLTGFTSAMR